MAEDNYDLVLNSVDPYQECDCGAFIAKDYDYDGQKERGYATLNPTKRKIQNMMKHYFEFKDHFPIELYKKAKRYLNRGQNPFLYILEEMQSYLENTNYYLASDVFGLFLQNA